MTYTRAQHPPACPNCDGTGWQPGPPIVSQAGGQPVTYTTVTPCTHPWWNDEPTLLEADR